MNESKKEVSEHMKKFLEEYPAMEVMGQWYTENRWYDIGYMSDNWKENVMKYLERVVKPAYAFNQRSDEEKEIARIIDDKIAEFEDYL